MIFDWMQMAGNYESRKVENTVVGDSTIDTCAVSDCGEFSYETGIKSPLYNSGKWVIVENYRTIKQAQAGHARWCEVMKNPPKVLVDTQAAEIAQLARAFTPEGENPDLSYERGS